MRKVVTDEEVPESVFFQKNYLVEEKKWQTEVNKETEERGSASTWVAEGKRPSKLGRMGCRPVTWHHRDGAEAIAEVTGYSQSDR